MIRRSVLFLISVALILPAAIGAQSVDAALLAKANAGDAAAQVAVGDQYAKAGGAPVNRIGLF